VSVGVIAGLPSSEIVVDVLARSPNADLRWVCSDGRRGHSGVGGRRGILHTTRCSDVLADEQVDAVMIVAPVEDRSSLAAAALDADKHVYVNGLLAQQAADAEELLRTARQRGRVLAGGGVHRFDTGVTKLSELLRSGEMGDVLYLECERRFCAGEEDLLWGCLAEEVEVVLTVLADEPTSVSAQSESYVDPAAPDLLDVRLTFATGILALIRVSGLDARTGTRQAVVGSRATAVFDHSPPMLTLYPKPDSGEAAVVCPRLAAGDPLRDSCEAFLTSVRALAAVEPGNAVAVLEVLEHIQTSLKRGRTIELSQPARELRVVGLPVARSRA